MEIPTTPAVRWFLDRYHARDAGVAMCALARSLRSGDDIGPPFGVIEPARECGVHTLELRGIPSEGYIEPRGQGFAIVLNARGRSRGVWRLDTSPPEPALSPRQRYSVAHEIGHTFFFDLGGATPQRPHALAGRDQGEERLCDVAAAELLMPRDAFTKAVRGLEEGNARAVVGLAEHFGVSIHAACRRIVEDLNLQDVVYIYWSGRGRERRNPDSGEPADPRFGVEWPVNAAGTWVPRGAVERRVPGVAECRRKGGDIDVVGLTDIGSLRGTFRASSAAIVSASQVIGILTLVSSANSRPPGQRPVAGQQLTLPDVGE